MKEHFILLGKPMVLATLDYRKRMTRRVMKPQPEPCVDYFCEIDGLWKPYMSPGEPCDLPSAKCPYGAPGDILHVKEASWIWCEKRPNGTTPTGRPKYRYIPVGQHVIYCADHPERPTERIDDDPTHMWRYKTGRFMPRWASRITLRVTDVRVERVQDITEDDCIAEGVSNEMDIPWMSGDDTPHGLFGNLWDSINIARGFGWDTNCWVWVISFEVQEIRK